MRVYFEFIKNGAQTELAYRMSVFLRIASQLFILVVRVAMWNALLKAAGGGVATDMGYVNLEDMMTYNVMSSVATILISTTVLNEVDEKIKSGQVSIDLIRPFNFKGSLFCSTIGTNSVKALIEALPLFIVSFLLYDISVPSLKYLLLSLFCLVNALVLLFMLNYVLGLLGFWYLSVWQFRMIVGMLIMILGGQQIPLWFFPDYLVDVSAYLPFRLVYFAPLSIFLEKISLIDSLSLILQQFLWIGFLILIEKTVWSRGIRKLVIQGG